jgi:transcriptional regulator with XRE-family HTH domain
MDLLELLQQIRAERKLSNNKFADFLGIDRGYWIRFKNGVRNFGPETLQKIIAIIPVSEHYVDDYAARRVKEPVSKAKLTSAQLSGAMVGLHHSGKNAPADGGITSDGYVNEGDAR